MKLLDLFERKRTKPRHFYHGTSSVFADSILKHGLLANPPKRLFGDDEWEWRSVNFTSEVSPLQKGLYLTDSRYLASTMAEKATVKFGGRQMIVYVKASLGSFNYDEEDLFASLADGFVSSFGDNVLEEFEVLKFNENKEIKFKKKILKIIFKNISHNGKINEYSAIILNKLVDLIFDKFVINGDAVPYYDEVFYFRDMIKQDNEMGRLVVKLTQNIDNIINGSVYVTRNIGFKGRNKIVDIHIDGKGSIYKSP